MAPLGENAYAPVVPTQAMGFTDDDDWEVVGESRYLGGIKRIKHLMDAAAGSETLIALLVAEPGNPFDRHAVRVDLILGYERETCGYLPREQAYRIQPLVRQANDDGILVFRNAAMYGGTSEKPNIGIWLSASAVAADAKDFEVRQERDLSGRGQVQAADRGAAIESVSSAQLVPSSGKRSIWKRLGF